MQPAQVAAAESDIAPGSSERPWLFAFLIAPEAVISLGLLGGGLSYLLRNEGVDPARGANIIALLSLPHAIYFLWGPLTDFWMPRRTWILAASAATAVTFVAAFHGLRLSSSKTVGLMFVGACIGVFVPAACGGMMGALHSEVNRRRASSYYQIGSLAFGAAVVFALVSLSSRVSVAALGWNLAGIILLPSLFTFAAPKQTLLAGQSARETLFRIWSEFKATFLTRKAIPYTLLVIAPFCSGSLIGLLPGLAADYGVNGAQVAWINGVGGALLTAGGAYAASLIPIGVRASVAYPIAGLVNAATAAILALGPQRPWVYFLGTVIFLFTIGAGYAFFTGVALEFLGASGKSGSSRYAIINSLGNLPVAYMSWIDGRGYAHWGPRGMAGTDAVISACGASLLLAHFIVSRLRKRAEQAI
jgi:MFS transporter, PAT family, beta-lactamase induction signal transducer AmpG